MKTITLKEPPELNSFKTIQVDLFQDFMCNSETERQGLSNTIELWDILPKYSISQKEQNNIRAKSGGHLPLLNKTIEFMGNEYEIFISPALISDEQGKAYYPSANEELVENALRRLATLQNQCFFENRAQYKQSESYCGVTFTLYQLIEELKKHKHTRSYSEIVKSLKILAGATIEIKTKNGRGLAIHNFISLSGFSEENRLSNPNSKWFVGFHPLVYNAMETISYRQFDYEKMMGLKVPLARWFFKRLTHYYTNASMIVPLTVSLKQIQQESGFLVRTRSNDSVRELIEVFNILVAAEVFNHFEAINDVRGPSNKIIDIVYKIFPHENFVKNVKRANKRQADAKIRLTINTPSRKKLGVVKHVS